MEAGTAKLFLPIAPIPWRFFGDFLGVSIYNASATVNKKSDSKRERQ